MSYVQGTLSKDEEIKEVAKLHWFNYVKVVLWSLFAIFFLLAYLSDPDMQNDPSLLYVTIILLIWPAYLFLKLRKTEMVITNKRVICREGIISVKTEELKNAKIESVEIRQSVLGRLFGYATIYFSGTGTSKVKFESVQDPWVIKSRAESIIGD
jgi:uncharacterized membrane protein YdbT with pleckstrin-like domain